MSCRQRQTSRRFNERVVLMLGRLRRGRQKPDALVASLGELSENVLCTFVIGALFGSNRLIEFAL